MRATQAFFSGSSGRQESLCRRISSRVGVVALAADADLAAARLALAGQHLDQLPLAVAGDAGDADDLAGLDRQRDVVAAPAGRHRRAR